MGTKPDIPRGWTDLEGWVWEQIVAGEAADLNARCHDQKNVDPLSCEGWTENRRLSVKFLHTILTQKAFVDSNPYGVVRILGALVDDAPLNLENARLQQTLWLELSRILIDVKCRDLTVDGGLSLKQCFVAGKVELESAKISSNLEMDGSTFQQNVKLNGVTVNGSAFLSSGATFKGEVDLVSAKIGSNLEMQGSIYEGNVKLNRTTVNGSAFLSSGATFKGEVDLVSAKIGSNLAMRGSSFEKIVNLNRATVAGSAFLRSGATFMGEVNLGSAKIGSNLEMDGSTFEGTVNLNRATVNGSAFLSSDATFKSEVDLGSAKIGSMLVMEGATFEKNVNLNGTTVDDSALLRNATFKDKVDLGSAKIGSNLAMQGSTYCGVVDLTGCKVTGYFLLGLSETNSARWNDKTSLKLRNAHVGALQDWWQSDSKNAWPAVYQLEGFTYDRLGSIAEEKEADMLDRPVTSYTQWLNKNTNSSAQPYEQLARLFREAGEPYKSTDILYAAKEQRRRRAWSKVGNYGYDKKREWLHALGLLVLRVTIGYGLGNRYFRALLWVAGMTLLGTIVLIVAGSNSPASWPRVFFASLDQLLPIITLDKAHDTLIFGDSSAKPCPVAPQPYGVLVYFYAHKITGWVLGSFLVAGLAGLTQRN